jgi:hypothetical protein
MLHRRWRGEIDVAQTETNFRIVQGLRKSSGDHMRGVRVE